ncbi:MAG: cytosine permease [Acidobacteria bacterium]|nr:cytosine permease [Acidobacteriota bacterium]
MNAVDLRPIAANEQQQSPFDLFLIFAGANIVATTLQVGASLPASLAPKTAMAVIAAGAAGGALLTALLAPVGSRLRLPSIVAARAALGTSGAQVLALLLFLTNFAWIALNNVIAGSIGARVTGLGAPGLWAAVLGLMATLVVLGGPRLAALVDRVAVPLMLASGSVFTWACIRHGWPAASAATTAPGDLARGLDLVMGYQVSWLLMFADYPRYVRSARGAGIAVFFGLALTALWFMALGLVAAAAAGSSEPGAMVEALGLGWSAALLLTLATFTTNFVNIYMSALALRSLRPQTTDAAAVWLIGGIGAALGLLSTRWLDQFAGFMIVLATTLVPVGGLLLARYVVRPRAVNIDALYPESGAAPFARWYLPGIVAWIAGAVVYQVSTSIGGTLPSLVTAIVTFVTLDYVVNRRD